MRRSVSSTLEIKMTSCRSGVATAHSQNPACSPQVLPASSRRGRRKISPVSEIKAWSQMFASSVLVRNMEMCKNFSSLHVESRSIFNLLVRMDDSFEKENCGIKKKTFQAA